VENIAENDMQSGGSASGLFFEVPVIEPQQVKYVEWDSLSQRRDEPLRIVGNHFSPDIGVTETEHGGQCSHFAGDVGL
jgi:hypothetical protein